MAERQPHPHNPIFLILAGGSGTRFWPLSRPDFPKQYLTLLGDKSLIAQTVERVAEMAKPDSVYICSVDSQKKLLEQSVPSVRNFVFEPAAKNTGPCILLSILELLRKGVPQDRVMVVLPSDHYIKDVPGFQKRLSNLIGLAQEIPGLFTLGIVPDSPHTGYGYIETGEDTGDYFKVKRFLEKPNLEKAKELIQTKRCFWNSGIFVWQLGVIKAAFEKWMPEEWKALSQCRTVSEIEVAYKKLKATPVDIGVIEKAENVYVMPFDVGWNDVGSWDALLRLRTSDKAGNSVVSGQAELINTQGCLVQVSPTTRVALVGVSNLIVVENNGTLLIADRNQDQDVRKACKAFEPSLI